MAPRTAETRLVAPVATFKLVRASAAVAGMPPHRPEARFASESPTTC